MTMEIHEVLNELYEPLYTKAKGFYKFIPDKYEAKLMWYNLHSKKIADEYVKEYYPIPVITIKGVCDIGIDFDHTFIEVVLPKKQALETDFNRMIEKYDIEVYGNNDYLNDIYNKSMDKESIVSRIKKSEESHINIFCKFDVDVSIGTILELLKYTY